VKSGDRVALVYPNNDPINFICSFYGCLFAGVVPVPIEVPLTRRVSFGFFMFYEPSLCSMCVAWSDKERSVPVPVHLAPFHKTGMVYLETFNSPYLFWLLVLWEWAVGVMDSLAP